MLAGKTIIVLTAIGEDNTLKMWKHFLTFFESNFKTSVKQNEKHQRNLVYRDYSTSIYLAVKNSCEK